MTASSLLDRPQTPAPAAAVPPRPAPALPPSPAATRIHDDAQALAVAQALATRFAERALERDRDRLLPWEEVDAFSASGLWGITVPRAYGGAGVSPWTLAQVVALISAVDGSLGHIPQNHYYALEVLRVGGSEAQKQFFFDRVLRGERLGNALAEIGHKDYKRRTHLQHGAEGWVLQGQKFYCTGALFSHWIPTLAVSTVDGAETSFLVFVPRTAPGVDIVDDWDGFGQRVTGSGSVSFHQVQVDPAWIVPFKTSFDTPTTIGPFAQLIHSAIDLGIGQGAFAATLPYIRQHARPWMDAGVPTAADDPLTVHQIGNVHLRLHAAQVVLEHAAQVTEAAQANPTEDTVAAASIAVAQAKVLSTQAGLLAADKLFELSGTSSSLAGHGLDRFWRNVRTHTLHDPVRWKVHAIGNYALNGKRPPRHGAL